MTGPSPHGKSTILLADDEALLRELGQTILSQAGYTVITMYRRDQLQLLLAPDSAPIDLLVTDVAMPEISGQEVAALVRARWPRARVIYASGYPIDEIPGIEGDAGFLQKPFTPTELTAKVREMLGG
jgi:DNA-binding response OmpR family regulator